MIMWKLYDGLIEPIPAGFTVDEILVGRIWTMVRAGDSIGVAMTVEGQTRPAVCDKNRAGMSLRDTANLVKSWNLIEASIGTAAINAYYNTEDNLKQLHPGSRDVFLVNAGKVKDKRVAVVGHFVGIEKHLEAAGELSILERIPQKGDYPDTACEYILPGQDFVFITGCALTNKTMPRLLELSRGRKVILAGPSVPLAPILFQFGASEIGGLVVTDIFNVRRQIAEGNDISLYSWGKRFLLTT